MASTAASTTPDLYADLRMAQDMARRADALTMATFRSADLAVSTKADHTPVSEADKAVEAMVRATLAEQRPDDAIHGEEMADTGSGLRRWIVDPIDGTANYVRGVPIWATLIGLMVDSRMVLGVVSAPALGRRWWAHEGAGAMAGPDFDHGSPIKVSTISSPGEAFLSYSSLHGWQNDNRAQGFTRLMAQCGRTRAFGDFFSYMLVAEGAVDIACEPDLELYDMAALVSIVTEAGGTFSNLDGVPGPAGRGALATNGLLHNYALGQLRHDPR